MNKCRISLFDSPLNPPEVNSGQALKGTLRNYLDWQSGCKSPFQSLSRLPRLLFFDNPDRIQFE